MKFEAPQIIYSCLMLVGMGICIARYGQQKTDKYDIIDCLIGPSITVAILYWGGFYG